jgi:hypothetical protein
MQHRLDPPGLPMHWSRVVDLLQIHLKRILI